MEDQSIKQLMEGTERLIKKFKNLENDYQQLHQQHNSLKDSLASNESKLKLMEENVNALKLAGGSNGNNGTDQKEIKNILNGYIKEIDRCIALLRN